MRKIVAMILVAMMALSLGACASDPSGEQADQYAGTFRAGFSEVLINPKESVPLGGYGNTSTRMSQNITEDLYLQCIALTDENENTVLLMAIDAIRVGDNLQTGLAKVAEATGVPFENVLLNASHSHSAPDFSNKAEESVPRYTDFVNEQMVVVAQQALEDRRPAQMYYGSSETAGLSFIRHYLMDDGTYGGDSFGDWTNHYAVEHVAEPDTTIHLLKFTREGGRDIVLANWRCHPGLTGSAGKALNVSADFLGPFRRTLEDMADCEVMYLQGHAGNTNPGSRISSEVEYSDYKEHGYLLATYANEGLQNMEQLETGAIRTNRVNLVCNVDHTMDHLAVKAAELATIWNKTNDRQQVIELGAPYGIRSPYQASAIRDKSKRGETEEVQINAIAIGDSVGFTAAPAELFDRNSMAIEEASPFTYTLCLGYTNGHMSYIPAAYVWEYTSYETDISRFEAGTAEQIQDTMLQMLEGLSQQ